MTTWKKYRLGDVCDDVSYGYTASAQNEPVGPKFLRITDIQDNFINWETVPYCSIESKNYEKNKLEFGDIVIARTGNSTGQTALFKSDIDAVFASYLIRFKPNQEIANPFYIDFLLRSNDWRDFVQAIKGGSAQPGANAKQFSEFEISLPPLPEQRRIAEILGSLDDKIELNLEMNKTLEQMAMLLYKRWFVDFEFPDSTGKPYKSNGGEFIDSELGLIPKGWEVKKLGDVVDTLGGGTPSTSKPEYWENGTINWYSPTDLTKANSLFSLGSEKKINEVGLNKSSAKLFPAYSLLMSSRATIGAITINRKPACTNQGFITLIPNEVISLYQLHGWIVNNMDLILSEANGSTFKEITKGNFRQFPILKPKDNSMFIAQASNIYSIIEENIIENQTLSEIRDTVLPKLISGEVRVKVLEQDLRD